MKNFEVNQTVNIWGGEQATVLHVGTPSGFEEGTEVHKAFLGYLVERDEEECTRLLEIPWVVLDTPLGVHCLPAEELNDLMC